MTDFVLASALHRGGALNVWRTSNTARGKPPSPARIARVEEKLSASAACLVVGCDGDAVIAMALAEPRREADGAGVTVPHTGHVSMVFVAPERWAQGVGGQLVDALHDEMRALGWTTSSLWTGSQNHRARRLYEGRGYRLTGEVTELAGEEILRYERRLDGAS